MPEDMRIDLKYADLGKLAPGSMIAILGRAKRIGKTTFAKWLTDAQQVPNVHVMCGGDDELRSWRATHPGATVTKPDVDELDKIRKDQEKLIKADRARFVEAGGDALDYEIPLALRKWVVFDDTGYKRGFNTSASMVEFACNHRHLGVDIVFLMQYFNQIPHMVRDQIDYVGMFRTTNIEIIRKVYDYYVGADILPTRRAFHALLEAATHDRGAVLWIDNTDIDSQSVEERLYYARAPCPPSAPDGDDGSRIEAPHAAGAASTQ